MTTTDQTHDAHPVLALARTVLLACAVICLSALLAAPGALALTQRGHEYCASCTIGSRGAGDGQLAHPTGVAVNDQTGDLYVLDSANNRIERFDSGGEFLQAWGWGVTDASKEFQTCAPPLQCDAGLPGIGKFQLSPSARYIAVDNSTSPSDPARGDVYVIAEAREERAVIDRFGPAGEPLEAIKGIKESFAEVFEAEQLHGLAVATDGTLWIYYEEQLYGLAPTAPTLPAKTREAGSPRGNWKRNCSANRPAASPPTPPATSISASAACSAHAKPPPTSSPSWAAAPAKNRP